jgi:hydroxypyruvate reductase
MNNLSELRIAAKEIFDGALRGVNAADAVRRSIQFSGSHFSICDTAISARSIYSVAIGKAALSMSYALEQKLGQFFNGGVMVGPSPNLEQAEWLSKSRWNWYVGGHPLPSRESLSAAADAVGLLQRANRERALILFLISGGGSAMLEWPAMGNISLRDLQEANRVLVGCGASISEINSVRRAFSAVKGGKLAARAPHCDQVTLIVSDVPAGEEHNVASGPTIRAPHDAASAGEVVDSYDLKSHLPESIMQAIENAREFSPASECLRESFVLLSNENAVRSAASAAQEHGFTADIAAEISDQSIADGCAQLRDRLDRLGAKDSAGAPVCLISGGEFACPVNGDGVGGRNLETALRLAMLNSSPESDFVALCAGTDGVDGNSPAAGAIVDSTTIARSNSLGLNAEDFLRRSDAYSFFSALGDTITIGPTGTNVRDLRILLLARK